MPNGDDAKIDRNKDVLDLISLSGAEYSIEMGFSGGGFLSTTRLLYEMWDKVNSTLKGMWIGIIPITERSFSSQIDALEAGR